MADFASALEKIQRHVKQTRVRLKDFFAIFDKLHTKRILANKFERAMSMAGVHMTQAEIQALAAGYPDDKFDGFVNYQNFCDEIETVFTIKHLEKSPTKEVHCTLEDAMVHKYGVALSDSEQAIFDE